MLKQREQKILDYMKSEIKTKGYPPTVREICTALHIKSTSTAHKDIESLVRQGYLVKDPSKPRALMVVDPQEAFGHIPAGKMPAAPAREAGADGTSRFRMSLRFRLSAALPQALRFSRKRTLRTAFRFRRASPQTARISCCGCAVRV